MSFEIQGTLHKKYDVESKSASFQTREFVIVTQETYPQYIKFQLTQDRCELIDIHQEGEQIKVAFDLRGREWSGKYFTNLNAWRVEKVVPEASKAASNPMPGAINDFPSASDMPNMEYNDDLPF
jgi:hypothetical protein